MKPLLTMNKAIVMLTLMLFSLPFSAKAQQKKGYLASDSTRSKMTTTSYMIGGGATQVLDTYLSQEHFDGLGLSFLSTTERQRPGNRWSTILQHQFNFSSVEDRSADRNELEACYSFFWGRYYSWKFFGDKLLIQGGGLVNAGLGAIYNTSNSNNPVQARCHINLMPSGAATYRFSLFGRRAALRYQLDLPLFGVMFSPEYGQSYYEIGENSGSKNIVATTFVSQPYFRQQFMVDYNLSRTFTMRLGYLGDYQQADVNNIKSHIYSHRLMVGFVKRFQLINYRP